MAGKHADKLHIYPVRQVATGAGENISNLPLEEQIDQLLGLEMITSPGGQTTENQSSLAAYYLSPEILSITPDAYLTTLESLRTLRDKLRDHYVEQTPTLENLIQFIDLHRSLDTRITTNRAQASHLTGAITLMSAHVNQDRKSVV